MTFFKTSRRMAIASAAAFTLVSGASLVQAEQKLDSIHFLIPGGAGGGWDGTARGTGEALMGAGLVGQASYENMSGGGGGKAISYLIENAESNHGTLMVNSTPIVIRSLTGMFPQNFRDLTLIAGTIGDYAAIITKADSELNTFEDLVKTFNEDSSAVSIGGGSVPGGMDHLVAAMAFEGAGADSTAIKYIPYDAGGEMNAAILSGEITAGSTGLSEAIELAKAGEMKVLAITAPDRVDALPDAPTLKELGYDVEFVNWRGFFGAPGLSEEEAEAYRETLAAMYDTPEWAEVRDRNGWVDIHNSGDDFLAFLEAQETTMSELMKKLGFL